MKNTNKWYDGKISKATDTNDAVDIRLRMKAGKVFTLTHLHFHQF